jgi:YD repeat-containing protein
VTDAGGNTTRFKYDNVGNLIEVIDACGNTTRREYDAVGRLILVVDPIGNTTSIEYNGSGKVKSSTDALGRKREYEYENGKLVAEKYQGKAPDENKNLMHLIIPHPERKPGIRAQHKH